MQHLSENNNLKQTKQESLFVIVLSSIAFILGVLGYYQYHILHQSAFTPLDLAYDAISLFIFELNADERPLPISLEFSRWLSPLALAYAVVNAIRSVLYSSLEARKMLSFNGHAVIIGLNEKTLKTAQSFIEQKINVIVIGEEGTSDLIGKAAELGCYLALDKHKSPTEQWIKLIKKAKYLVIAGEEDQQNLDSAFYIFNSSVVEERKEVLLCAVEIENKSLALALEDDPLFQIDYPHFSAKIFNYHKLSARYILKYSGPDRLVPWLGRTVKDLNVIVVGANELLDHFLYRLVTIGHYGNQHPINLAILDESAGEKMNSVTASNSVLATLINLQSHNVNFSLSNISHLKTYIDNFAPSIVYLFPATIEQYLIYTQIFKKLVSQVPMVLVMGKGLMLSISAKLLKLDDDFIKCSPYSSACDFDTIFNDAQDREARLVHENYIENQKQAGDSSINNSSLVEWDVLPEILKDSNRNQVDHIEIKCRLLTGKSNCSWDEFERHLNEKTIEYLAQTEHDRWYTEKLLAGWRYTSGEKNADLRLSPSLIPWDELSESEKQKDINAIYHLKEVIEIRQSLASKDKQNDH